MSSSQQNDGGISLAKNDDRIAFKSGARSSRGAPRFDLIPNSLLEVLANRLELGLLKYGKGNYAQGYFDDDFVIDRLNHLQQHLNRVRAMIYNENFSLESDDDDLAAVAWGVMFLIEMRQARRTYAVAKDAERPESPSRRLR